MTNVSSMQTGTCGLQLSAGEASHVAMVTSKASCGIMLMRAASRGAPRPSRGRAIATATLLPDYPSFPHAAVA